MPKFIRDGEKDQFSTIHSLELTGRKVELELKAISKYVLLQKEVAVNFRFLAPVL